MRINKLHIIALSTAFATVIILSIAVFNHGLGITNDSVDYLSAANSINQQYFPKDAEGNAFVTWPLGYPLFISLFKGHFSIFTFAQILLAGLASYVLALWQKDLHPLIKPFWLINIVFATPLYLVFGMIWSESIFILLLIAHIHFLYRWIQSQKAIFFYLSIATIAFLPLCRYIGIFAFLPFTYILYNQLKGSSTQRLFQTCIYTALTSLPLLYQLYFNFFLGNSFLGVREKSIIGFGELLYKILLVSGSWFVPNIIGNGFPLILSLLLFIALIYTLIKKDKSLVYLCALYGVMYIMVLIYSHAKVALEPIDDRFMAPTMMLFLFVFWSTITTLQSFLNKRYTILLLVGISFIPIYQIIRTTKNSMIWNKNGFGTSYNTPYWKNSDFIKKIESLSSQHQLIIYTDQPRPLVYHKIKNEKIIVNDQINLNFNEIAKCNRCIVTIFKDQNITLPDEVGTYFKTYNYPQGLILVPYAAE